MRIKIIGSGSASAKENCACSLIDNKILIDCGNGIVKNLMQQNVNFNKIEALLVTHLHGDHFLDISTLILVRSFDDVEKELNIYGPVGIEKVVSTVYKLSYPDNLEWSKLKEKARVCFIEFESLKQEEVSKGYFVDSYELIHGELTPVYGYVIKNNNKCVGVSGDTSYCSNIDKIIEESDISILDMSFIECNYGHMGVNDIEMLANKYNKKIISTHMTDSSRKYAKERVIQNLIVPCDGNEFDI